MDLLLSPLLANAFTLWGTPTTWLEVIAVVLALAMVVFNIRVNPLAWPLAIVSSLLYVLLFWNSKLYGDAGLQVFFAAVGLWGWWQWLRGTQAAGTPLRVRHLAKRETIGVLVATLAAWPLLGLFLDLCTDTDVPYWDAFPTTASIAGQWLLGRKYVQNWPAWLIVNAVSVALFAYKGLWLTVLLYALFLAMSVAGWQQWRRLAAAAR
ncbi:MAG TPA: nicotinamide riboside transporter PnuC [Burkholderiaceae bacterium]|nr:nicotinamide riboside transporter PnuC [Burkholderiaceae bacterium]